jgi:hypothetical protein
MRPGTVDKMSRKIFLTLLTLLLAVCIALSIILVPGMILIFSS